MARRKPKPNPPGLLFRIRNKQTGMFANLRGGWDTTGRTWAQHHAVLGFLERQWHRFPPGTAEVVTYEVKVLVTHPVEAFEKSILEKKAKRVLTQKKWQLRDRLSRAKMIRELQGREEESLLREARELEAEIRAMERGAA